MKILTKRLVNGFEMPVFGLGTWQMGGRETHLPDNDDKNDISAIQKAIESGVTHIDTAESYADGYAETLVGKAIKDYDRRKLFIVSKVRKTNLAYDHILRSCEDSLKRLDTDYLDLYLIHAPNPQTQMEEWFQALDKLMENKSVKNIGVSNFRTERLIEAQKMTKNKIVVNQVYYNLIMREPESDGLLKYCQENDVFLEAYRPLEKGAILNPVPSLLEKMADKYGKTPAQTAINWLISQKNVVTISKASTPEHLEEILGAVDWLMESTDIELLRNNFPNQQYKPETLPLR